MLLPNFQLNPRFQCYVLKSEAILYSLPKQSTINNQESDVWISSLKEKHIRSEAASQEVIGQKEIK